MTYKVDVFWSAWTPQIATRVMRDMMALQRVTRTNRVQLIVACDPLLVPKMAAIGVQTVDNFLNPNLVRIYVPKGYDAPDDVWARVPEDSDVEVISLLGEEIAPPGISVDKDPYAGVKFYQSWRPIPPTMPLDQAPPPKVGEPMFSPFL